MMPMVGKMPMAPAEMEQDQGEAQNMDAVIEALEQARAALDAVEAAATGARRDKAKAPPVEVEEAGEEME